MNLLGRKKKDQRFIDPSASVTSHVAHSNEASTAGYQNAIRAYNNTIDPDNGAQSSVPLTQYSPTLSDASPFVRNVQGTSIPASFFDTSINERRNINAQGIQNTNPQFRYQSGPPSPDSNTNSLTYSQSVESSSPEKHGTTTGTPKPPLHRSPPSRIQGIGTNQLAPASHSSSTMDDYADSSSQDYDGNDHEDSPPNSPSSYYSFPIYPGSPALHHRNVTHGYNSAEPEMVDTTYAEHYGDAYTGKPLRYIYPQGYGSMRPRSRPWQIALIFCAVFAWLNVFIVGHCADRFDWEQYNDDKYQNQQIDDDAMVIETRWCGSRTLYFTWVLSVALTGLSFAYCSIIGYVKARDFAVANGRSQPPGMAGKSDYYVQIEEQLGVGNRRFGASHKSNHFGSDNIYSSYQDSSGLKKTIYQADGTPRFFGGQIYKPTQAAVSLTSR